MILAVAMFVVLIAAVVLEGRTIWICSRAAGPAGAARLTVLGSTFLASEIWVVALVGLMHGAYPGLLHVLMGASSLGAVVYVAGWMLRDLGLWTGPRVRAQTFARSSVAFGAMLQVLGCAMFVIAALAVLPRTTVQSPDSGTLLAVVTVPVLLLGATLQILLYRLPPAAYFRWDPRLDPFEV